MSPRAKGVKRVMHYKTYKGDSFDVFCLRQRARLSHKLQRVVTRVVQRNDNDSVDTFEGRK